MRPSASALLLACCLVLAGCNAPTAAPTPTEGPQSGPDTTATTEAASTTEPSTGPPEATETPASTDTPTPTPTPDATVSRSPAELADGYRIQVRDGELPLDYSLVFARVAVLLERPDVEPPGVVYVRDNDRMGVGASRFPEFYRLLGIRVPEGRDSSLTAAAYVTSGETVFVNRAILNDTAAAESTLAHESVHVIQHRVDAFDAIREAPVAPARSTEASLLRRALVEGPATYTQSVYRERYVPEAPAPVASLRAAARNRSGAAKLGIAPYLVGAAYVEGRVEKPGAVRRIYETPPRTTEELIHGLAPGSEPVAPLAVREAEGDDWETVAARRDTMGELFVRVALWTELNESRAAAGAAGWGADERVVFEPTDDTAGSPRGYAWVLRFDDAANATEFERAFADWRAARERDAGGDRPPVRAVRATDRTVVVFLGNESFVSGASADGSGGEVTISVEESG